MAPAAEESEEECRTRRADGVRAATALKRGLQCKYKYPGGTVVAGVDVVIFRKHGERRRSDGAEEGPRLKK